jgi:O-antigen ligase
MIDPIYPLGRVIGWEGIDRIYHYGFSAGSLFWTWLVALVFGQIVYNEHLHRFWRFGLLCLLLITLYNAFVQAYDWKSGWLPPLVAIGVILAARSGRLILLLSLAALVPAFFVAKDLIGTDLYSWGTRVDAWVIVLGITKVNPLFGLGFANYYWYTPLFPIRGFSVVFNSHSQYVDLIAEVGLLGLAAYLWFFAAAGRLGWKLRTTAPPGFARAYVYGALGGLAGTLVAGFLVDWVIPFVYNIGMTGFRASVLFWLFLGGLVSIEQIVRRDALKTKEANA